LHSSLHMGLNKQRLTVHFTTYNLSDILTLCGSALSGRDLGPDHNKYMLHKPKVWYFLCLVQNVAVVLQHDVIHLIYEQKWAKILPTAHLARPRLAIARH